MPETLTLEDGSTREVPTQEELKELQEAKTSNETKVGELQTELDSTREQLKEAENPNWKALRQDKEAFDRTRKNLAEQGIKVDDQGNILKEQEQGMTAEQVVETSRKVALEVSIENELARKLSSYDEDSKAVIRKQYDKLTAGENIDLSNLDNFINSAVGASGLSNPATPSQIVQGARPSGGEPKDTPISERSLDRGKDIAKSFGYKFNSKNPDELGTK